MALQQCATCTHIGPHPAGPQPYRTLQRLSLFCTHHGDCVRPHDECAAWTLDPDADEPADDNTCTLCHGHGGGPDPALLCRQCHGTGLAHKRSKRDEDWADEQRDRDLGEGA